MGLVGRVVGTKMQKTAKVEVFRLSLDRYVLKVCHLYCLSQRYTKVIPLIT